LMKTLKFHMRAVRMTKDPFDKIWEQICAWSEAFCADHEGYEFQARKKTALARMYREITERFKTLHMLDGSDAKLDRHKIAAAFVISIVKIRPISISTEQKLARIKSDEFFCNEKLALVTAFAIIQAFIEKESGTRSGGGHIARLDVPNCVDGDYWDYFCKELSINRNENKLSLLSIANELFLLEYYNRKSKEA